MLLTLLLIPLLLAWSDLFRVTGQSRRHRVLATIGLLLLTSVPLLYAIARIKIHQAHGRLDHAIPLEQALFAAALLSIPFLCFGRRMTKWCGVASALILPFIAILINTLD